MRTRALPGLMLLIAAAMTPSYTKAATIYQCAHKNTGVLRLVESPSQCLPFENSVSLQIPVVVHGSVINGNAYTNGSRGFTYEEIQPGQYVITFSLPLDAAPDCVADIINPPINSIATCDTTNTNLSPAAVGIACRSYTPQTGTLALLDWDFTFMCIL